MNKEELPRSRGRSKLSAEYKGKQAAGQTALNAIGMAPQLAAQRNADGTAMFLIYQMYQLRQSLLYIQ